MKLLKYALLATLLFTCSLFSSNYAGAATFTVSPANIAQGNNVTAQWSGVATPTNRDWIGLYAPGAADTRFIDWIYDNSCNRAGNDSALGAGACPFLIPNTLPNGTYELRLYANNNYVRLATSNQFTVSPVPPARFVDNGDGTISDTGTGLMREQKTSATGRHNANNFYAWSSTGTIPDGSLFTNFLTQINRADGASSDGQTQDRKNYSDWRIPNIAELKTIYDPSSPTCNSLFELCINPVFGIPGATGLGTPLSFWSSTSAQDQRGAWMFDSLGVVGTVSKINGAWVIAVRGGR